MYICVSFFQLLNEHVPDGFLVADIKVTGQRHIVLATEKQMSLLNEAKQWYADGTFECFHKKRWRAATDPSAVCANDEEKIRRL